MLKQAGAAALLLCTSCLANADYSTHPEAKAFIERMVSEHGYDRKELTRLLAAAEKKQSILDAISRPAEKTKPWHEYRNIFLKEKRIKAGVQFWQDNVDILSKAEEQYGVPPQMIVAIIGVETNYGGNMGSYRVVDALSTLGFDYPRRSRFFSSELEHFFLLTREHNKDPLSFKGSYAGAMGYGQFIPSSYRRYAADFSGDGFADIWTNRSDAIGSVANYFKAHGWQSGKPVMTQALLAPQHDASLLNSRSRPDIPLKRMMAKGYKVKAGDFDFDAPVVPLEYQGKEAKEYWLGFNNFYVITRYNRSRLYARAVWELSEEIKSRYESHPN